LFSSLLHGVHETGKAAEKVQQLAQHEGTEILHLDYRQGPDLPALE
jgi:hypothetical protein